MEHDWNKKKINQKSRSLSIANMNFPNDTICAISTPQGVGGIAVIRISGPEALTITDRIWKGKTLENQQSHTAHLGYIVDPHDNQSVDQALATIFRAPHSFTSENVVELSVHGSQYIQSKVIDLLITQGARLAQPGEFTRRAFAAGNIDLAQAEAVADLIASNSQSSHRLAINQMRGGFSKRLTELRNKLLDLASLLELELDFSEEDVEFASRNKMLDLAKEIHTEVTTLHNSFRQGQAIKNGIPVAIAGATNAGKSSLLNAILGDNRAIVSDIHGTTRDTIEDTITLDGFTFRLIDTAGLRQTSDSIEKLGIDRTHQAIEKAEILLLVIDSSQPLPHSVASLSFPQTPKLLVALNKSDLPFNPETITQVKQLAQKHPNSKIIELSAKTEEGLKQLTDELTHHAQEMQGADNAQILVTNARHADALAKAAQSANDVIEGLNTALPPDLIAEHMRETLYHLGTITGAITTPEILSSIFTRFCIGK